jgi:transcription initiation factor TFIIB
MIAREIFADEGSDGSSGNERYDARNVAWRPTCPECDGQVVSEDCEAVCDDCGLVVTIDALERKPGLKAHAPDSTDRKGEWAVESTTELRVDKGLHTTFFLTADGKGNALTSRQRERMGRLRRRHKRFQMDSKRDNRLNEGFRDIGMIGANLSIPEDVQTDASRFLKAAKAARLPGGRMAWESLAAGAMLLATRRAGIERTPADIAEYAKAPEERVCAAARKIRLQTDVEAPPVRDRAVDRVVAALDDEVDVGTGIELVRIADRLMRMADSEPIGPGTPRMTVAGAAVYATDRLTDGKSVTQDEVAAAVERTLPTTKGRVARYSRELYDAAERRTRGNGRVTELVAAD